MHRQASTRMHSGEPVGRKSIKSQKIKMLRSFVYRTKFISPLTLAGLAGVLLLKGEVVEHEGILPNITGKIKDQI